MLKVNDDQLCLAGIASLEERCISCSKRLTAYPLIMGDDAKQAVYHMICALELASDLLAGVFPLFCPPAPYPPLFTAIHHKDWPEGTHVETSSALFVRVKYARQPKILPVLPVHTCRTCPRVGHSLRESWRFGAFPPLLFSKR
jgi:hypothetical protein